MCCYFSFSIIIKWFCILYTPLCLWWGNSITKIWWEIGESSIHLAAPHILTHVPKNVSVREGLPHGHCRTQAFFILWSGFPSGTWNPLHSAGTLEKEHERSCMNVNMKLFFNYSISNILVISKLFDNLYKIIKGMESSNFTFY